MKRFLLFAMWDYYPSGGWSDFVDSFETPEEAHKAGQEHERDDYHVVDSTTGNFHEEYFPACGNQESV